jgi:hypothetical protein
LADVENNNTIGNKCSQAGDFVLTVNVKEIKLGSYLAGILVIILFSNDCAG